MTHPIGRGTTNVTANLLTEERHALVTMALRRDISLSRLLRDLVLDALAQADRPTAARLAHLRRNHRREALTHKSQLTLDL